MHNLPPVSTEGWGAACPIDSPLRSSAPNLTERATVQSEKTFIYDHRQTMDICQHPQTVLLHGQFLRYDEHPPIPESVLSPQFSHCATSLHRDVAVVHAYGWVDKVSDDVLWEEKLDDRLLWRGSTTGIWHSGETRWRESHRTRLVNDTSTRYGHRTVLPPTQSNKEPVGRGRDMKAGRLNAATMDIGFAGDLNACDPKTCDLLREEFEVRPRQSLRAAASYKYVLDVRSCSVLHSMPLTHCTRRLTAMAGRAASSV